MVLILFWIDVHPNILILPFKFIMETLAPSYWTGWPYNMVNGIYYTSSEVPKTYLLSNLIFKAPEYILIAYLFFLFLMLTARNFFSEKFEYFNYKIFVIALILIFPNIILIRIIIS